MKKIIYILSFFIIILGIYACKKPSEKIEIKKFLNGAGGKLSISTLCKLGKRIL